MLQMLSCPRCQGAGGGEGLVKMADSEDCVTQWIVCNLCDGLGQISRRRHAAVSIGKHLRDHRVKTLAVSLADLSTRLPTFTPAAVSAVEHGTTPFTSWGDVLELCIAYECDHHELLEAMHMAGDDDDA